MSFVHTVRIQKKMLEKLEELSTLVERHMAEAGDTTEQSHKVSIRAIIGEAHERIVGIRELHLKAPDEGGDFLNALSALDEYGNSGKDAQLFAVNLLPVVPDRLITILMSSDSRDDARDKTLEFARKRLGLGDQPLGVGEIKALSGIEIIQLSNELF